MIKWIYKYFAWTFIALWVVMACSPKKEVSNNEENTTQIVAPENVDDPDGFAPREPTDDELNEYGLISELEEAGYPVYNVTISFPERELSSNFSLNVENAKLSDELMEFQDRYATIYYESEASTEVLDIIFNGKSLLGEYAPEDHEGLERIEGTLKGAVSESGDLPSTLQLEGEEDTLVFEYYVDAETISANEQPVAVYYYTRYVDVITYLQLSEN